MEIWGVEIKLVIIRVVRVGSELVKENILAYFHSQILSDGRNNVREPINLITLFRVVRGHRARNLPC